MPQPLRVLIVEDNIDDAELLVHELRRAGFEPDWQRVETESDFLAQLDPGLDLILSDFEMPQFSGLRALELLKQQGRDTPFIISSGTIGEDTAVAAIKQGATDYLLKDRLTRVGAAIRQALEQGRLRRLSRQSEEALIESERKFRLLAENITDVFWIAAPDLGKMEYVSPAYELIWGRPVDRVYADPHEWFGAILPEDRERVLSAFRALRRSERSTAVEYRIQRPDGEIRWIYDRGFQIRDEAGQVVRLTGVAADITERKLAEERIAEQAALLNKTRDAILVRDLEGTILFWNHGAERTYGWSREEAIGCSSRKLLYEDPKLFDEFNRKTISDGEWRGEVQQITRDGRPLVMEARWTLVRDEAGNPKSVLAINTDITERKHIEIQFMRAQRMESIGTLAGGIAHDLNNILTPIMMSIDILKSLSENPQAGRILETIEISARRGADIVRQVLSFARGLEGERIEVQPRHLVNDLESIIKDTFPKDIQLEFLVPETPWIILADPTQIHQVLLNLCVNARDAMPEGGRLSVVIANCVLDQHSATMNQQVPPGRYVRISVADMGNGIAPDILDKIFEPFFTTKALQKGTGLGLSTVLAIIKSHEGAVTVYSEPSHGTTFNIYLPALEASSDGRREQVEASILPRGNGETILLVDDEASILTIAGQTLQAFGYRVLTASDGAEAVGVYAQHNKEIAVVLTDMMMPIMDGAATIHALMRLNSKVKIIAASGLNANGSVARVAGAGVKHFLTKPYTAATLLKTVRTILDEK